MDKNTGNRSTAGKKRDIIGHSRAMGKGYPCMQCSPKNWECCAHMVGCERYRAWLHAKWTEIQDTLKR